MLTVPVASRDAVDAPFQPHPLLGLARASLLTLLLLALGPSSPVQAAPIHEVSLSAAIFATFNASPTLVTTRPDLQGGAQNVVVAEGPIEDTDLSASFREIYVGVGESGTSNFEAEYRGSVDLRSGALRIELLAKDQNNASATQWTMSGAVSYTETLTFDGPPDPNGNYVIRFTTHLGSLNVENTQPPGFTFWWRSFGGTTLAAEPVATGFDTLNLSTFATLQEDCPTLSGPPCFGFSKLTAATGEVTIPASNPVLTLTHDLLVTARSAHADASQTAFLEIELPAGVDYSSNSGLFLTVPIPEPGSSLLLLIGLTGLAPLRRWRSRRESPAHHGATSSGIAAAVLGLLLLPAMAEAVILVDQENVPPGAATSFSAGHPTLEGQQQITAGISGQLVAVDIWVSMDPTSDGSTPEISLNFFVNLGTGWQTDLDDFASVVTVQRDGAPTVAHIDVSSANILLGVGDPFMIGWSGIDDTLRPRLRGIGSDTYAGGSVWLDGSEWLDGGGDLLFRTYVDDGLPIPEPSSLLLLGSGLLGLALARRGGSR